MTGSLIHVGLARGFEIGFSVFYYRFYSAARVHMLIIVERFDISSIIILHNIYCKILHEKLKVVWCNGHHLTLWS